MTFTAVLRRIKVDAVPHGFPLIFRYLARAYTPTTPAMQPKRPLHMLLAIRSKGYCRGDLFDKRRRMMADRAAFVATLRQRSRFCKSRGTGRGFLRTVHRSLLQESKSSSTRVRGEGSAEFQKCEFPFAVSVLAKMKGQTASTFSFDTVSAEAPSGSSLRVNRMVASICYHGSFLCLPVRYCQLLSESFGAVLRATFPIFVVCVLRSASAWALSGGRKPPLSHPKAQLALHRVLTPSFAQQAHPSTPRKRIARRAP